VNAMITMSLSCFRTCSKCWPSSVG